MRRMHDSKGIRLYHRAGAPDQGKTYVYFVLSEENQRIKIGVASSVLARLRDMQTGSPCALTLLGFVECESRIQAIRRERELHKLFRRFRVQGLKLAREWFHFGSGLHRQIASIVEDTEGIYQRGENENALRSVFSDV